LFGSRRLPAVSWLVVGLGNPTPRHEGTRHNVGFDVATELARRWRVPPSQSRFDALFSVAERVSRVSGSVLLLWPQTYMNLSGVAVGKVFRRLDVPQECTIVVHDDLDLSLGRIKVKRGGGSGGHNGVQSVIDELGTAGFCRVRCGIDRPENSWAVSDYVLAPFGENEIPTASEMVQQAADAVIEILARGLHAAMNKYNRNADPSDGSDSGGEP